MIWRTNVTQAFADALDGRQPARGEVSELVAVATRLCQIAAETEPTTEFRTALRTQLMTMPMPSAVRVVSAPARRTSSARRWTVAFATLMAATFGATMSAASAATIPGDTLYPVKRAIENTELALKYSDSSRGGFHLKLATERLGEVDQLTSQHGTSSLTTKTLAEFQRQASLGSDELLRSYLSNDSRADIVQLNKFSSTSTRQLADLQGRLPEADMAKAQAVLESVAVRSTRVCPECDGSAAVGPVNRILPTETTTSSVPTEAATTTNPTATSNPTAAASVSTSAITPTPTSTGSDTASTKPSVQVSKQLSNPAATVQKSVKDAVNGATQPLKQGKNVLQQSVLQQLTSK